MFPRTVVGCSYKDEDYERGDQAPSSTHIAVQPNALYRMKAETIRPPMIPMIKANAESRNSRSTAWEYFLTVEFSVTHIVSDTRAQFSIAL